MKIFKTINRYYKALFLALKTVNNTAAYNLPRFWSNQELAKFSQIFSGTVLNVSAANDKTKQGKEYRCLFGSATTYIMSNFFCGRPAREGELFINLEEEIPLDQYGIADVVFNHTTLEHIFNSRIAFRNLCNLSKDIVITVVPFMQKMHGQGHYNDYWRFTPEAMRQLYEENGLTLRYCSSNDTGYASIYLFCIGYRNEKWNTYVPEFLKYMMNQGKHDDCLIGSKVFRDSFFQKFKYYLELLTNSACFLLSLKLSPKSALNPS